MGAKMRLSGMIYNIRRGVLALLSDNTSVILPDSGTPPQIDPTLQHVLVPLPFKRISLMRFTIPTRVVSTVTAAAIALTTFTAVPAYADDRQTARTVATIVGLAMIGAMINDHKQDKKKRHKSHSNQTKKKVYTQPQKHRGHAQPRQRVQPKPLPRRVSRKLLPQNCLRSYNTRRGQARIFTQRCLERSYHAVNRLPRSCAVRIRTDRGLRAGYGARCLRANGYRLARR